MTRVFLSYRRQDASVARALQASLEVLAPGCVVRDVSAFRTGDELRSAVSGAIVDCDDVVALIGAGWSVADPAEPAGVRHGSEWTRLELSLALAYGKRVIPVLIEATPMPERATLPSDLQQMTRTLGHRLRDSDWDADIAELARALGLHHHAPEVPAPATTIIDAGPIAGGNIVMLGNEVIGRDRID